VFVYRRCRAPASRFRAAPRFRGAVSGVPIIFMPATSRFRAPASRFRSALTRAPGVVSGGRGGRGEGGGIKPKWEGRLRVSPAV